MNYNGNLQLTRMPGESIYVIDEEGQIITLTIIKVNGKETRIGIDAPRKYGIRRSELEKLNPLERKLHGH